MGAAGAAGPWAGSWWALVGTRPAGRADDAPDLVPVPADARDPGLGVEQDDGGLRLTLRTGCNSGSAPLRLEPGDGPAVTLLHVGPVITTRMAGPADVMALEADVLRVLAASPLRAEVDGDDLTVTGGGRALVLRRR